MAPYDATHMMFDLSHSMNLWHLLTPENFRLHSDRQIVPKSDGKRVELYTLLGPLYTYLKRWKVIDNIKDVCVVLVSYIQHLLKSLSVDISSLIPLQGLIPSMNILLKL